MSTYIIESVVTHTVLILAYWVFLRKEHQYNKMRFFLILSTVLSLVIPLLRFPQIFPVQQLPMQELSPEFIIENATVVTTAVESYSFDYRLLIWLSLIVSAILLIKLISRIAVLFSMSRRSIEASFNGVRIKRLEGIEGSFTFFNWIFLSKDIDESQEDYSAIIKHEEAHARLGHSFDLLFFEIYKALFWWLPSSWYVNTEIRKLHEYQADSYALRTTQLEVYSSILINSTLQSHGLSMASSFHDGLIFKRLKAMKQQATKVSNWKMGLLTTLCAFLFVIFACSEEKGEAIAHDSSKSLSNSEEVIEVREIFKVVEEQPSYEGGMDAFYKHVINEIRYPLAARNTGVEGTVDVHFVIERDGSLSNVTAMNSIGAGCDEEAVRVVKAATGFKAGAQRGRTVRVAMVMPISFKLNPDRKNPDNSIQGSIIAGEAAVNNGDLDIDIGYKDGSWSGIVRTPEGDELPGVSINVLNSDKGVVSDLDGTFSVEADKSQELEITFVGYNNVVVKN